MAKKPRRNANENPNPAPAERPPFVQTVPTAPSAVPVATIPPEPDAAAPAERDEGVAEPQYEAPAEGPVCPACQSSQVPATGGVHGRSSYRKCADCGKRFKTVLILGREGQPNRHEYRAG